MSGSTSDGNGGEGDGSSKGSASHRSDLERAAGASTGRISDSLKKPLGKRFYKHASVTDEPRFQIVLDG